MVREGRKHQTIEGIQVHHLDSLPDVFGNQQIRFAIIAVPAAAAQEVADRLVKNNIDGILNFAPVTISVPKEVNVVGVDLAIELEQLSFAVVNRGRKS